MWRYEGMGGNCDPQISEIREDEMRVLRGVYRWFDFLGVAVLATGREQNLLGERPNGGVSIRDFFHRFSGDGCGLRAPVGDYP